jgi:hypothetical protein
VRHNSASSGAERWRHAPMRSTKDVRMHTGARRADSPLCRVDARARARTSCLVTRLGPSCDASLSPKKLLWKVRTSISTPAGSAAAIGGSWGTGMHARASPPLCCAGQCVSCVPRSAARRLQCVPPSPRTCVGLQEVKQATAGRFAREAQALVRTLLRRGSHAAGIATCPAACARCCCGLSLLLIAAACFCVQHGVLVDVSQLLKQLVCGVCCHHATTPVARCRCPLPLSYCC